MFYEDADAQVHATLCKDYADAEVHATCFNQYEEVRLSPPVIGSLMHILMSYHVISELIDSFMSTHVISHCVKNALHCTAAALLIHEASQLVLCVVSGIHVLPASVLRSDCMPGLFDTWLPDHSCCTLLTQTIAPIKMLFVHMFAIACPSYLNLTACSGSEGVLCYVEP